MPRDCVVDIPIKSYYELYDVKLWIQVASPKTKIGPILV